MDCLADVSASNPQTRQWQTGWLSAVVWLCAFLSPTVYFLLLLLAHRFQIHVSPTIALPLLLFLPVGALLICAWVVWSCNKKVGPRIGWMLFTVSAMLLQCAVLLVVLREILGAAVG